MGGLFVYGVCCRSAAYRVSGRWRALELGLFGPKLQPIFRDVLLWEVAEAGLLRGRFCVDCAVYFDRGAYTAAAVQAPSG